jgi:hypothetical protein
MKKYVLTEFRKTFPKFSQAGLKKKKVVPATQNHHVQ